MSQTFENPNDFGAPIAPPEKPQSNRTMWIIIIVVVVLLLCCCCLVLLVVLGFFVSQSAALPASLAAKGLVSGLV